MLTSLYRKAQYLSLDIVLGAVILLRFFSNQLQVEISVFIYLLLAGSVWLIYTIDHLRDARHAKNSKRGRYQFHDKNEKWLKVAIAIIILLCTYGVFQIELDLLISGSLIIVLSGIYLLIHQHLSKRGLKECYVALIYTIGILIAPFTALKSIEWDVAWLLFLLTLSNLILFSWFEQSEDEADEFNSIATIMDSSTMNRIILVLLSLGLASTILMEFNTITIYFLIAFVIYASLFINKNWSGQHFRYRTIGDGVFLFPILLTLI